MYCKICGAEGYEGTIVGQIIKNEVKIRWDKGAQALCDLCSEQTPEKIGKSEFDQKYWGEDYQDVPASIRKEFYDDYRTSTDTFEEYVIATKSEVEIA